MPLLHVLALTLVGCTPSPSADVDPVPAAAEAEPGVSLAPPEEPPEATVTVVPPQPEPEPAREPPPSEAPELTADVSWCDQPGCDPVITFSYPIVEELELDLAEVPPIEVMPPTPGAWQWISEHELQFVSDEGQLLHGASVSFFLDGLAPRGFTEDTLGPWSGSVHIPELEVGGKVASWAVESGKPRFVGFLQHFRMEVGPGPLFLLYDQPVEPDAIAKGLKVTDEGGKRLPVDVFRPDEVDRALSEEVDLAYVVAVDLRFDPPRDSVVRVEPPSYDEAPSWSLTVDDQLTFEGWEATDGGWDVIEAGQPVPLSTTLRLQLSSPVEPALLQHLSIEPTPAFVQAVGTWGYPGLDLQLEPGTTYTLRDDPRVIDALGNPVEPFTVTFRSRDLPPELHVPALPLTAELERPQLEIRGLNLEQLALTAHTFPDAESYAQALARGPATTCAEHGLEGDGTRVTTPAWDAAPNERGSVTVALPGSPGLRCVDVSAEGWGSESEGALSRAVLVATTDLGTTAKVWEGGVSAWVTTLSAASPAEGATVRVVDGAGTVLGKGVTDAMGLVHLRDVDPAHGHGLDETLFVVAELGKDRAVLRLDEDRLSQPWRFAVTGTPDEAPELHAALFTERGVYRPGDTAHATVMGGPALAGAKATLEVIDALGQQVTQATRTLDAFGVGSLDVPLPKGASVGIYRLRASVAGRSTSREFRVEEYRIPTFEIRVGSEAPWTRGEPAAAVIDARYLHGGTLDGRPVQYAVTREPAPFRPAAFRGYVFTDGPVDPSPVTLDSGSARLDGQGRKVLRFAPSHPSSTGPMRYTVEANVTDLDRQEYTGRRTEVVHAARFYVGVRPPSRDIVAAGESLDVPLAAVAPDGTGVTGVRIRARLERVDHHQTLRVGADGSASTLNREVAAEGTDCLVTTTEAGASCTFVVPQAGSYRVRAWARDPDSRDVVAGFALTATGNEPTAWPRFDRERIELLADRPAYAPGDVARLVVQTPFETATGLLTLERDGLLEQRVFTIDRDTPSIDVPITADMAPNVYASVVLLRGRTHDDVDAQGFETGAPAFRLGITELAVDLREQRLGVTVVSSKAIAVPGSELVVDLALTDPTGAPVAGQVAVMVVDEAVLGLTAHSTPDPVPELHPTEPLGVRTAESRLELAHALRARREVLFPGGDGGMIPGQLPTNELRNLFQSTAFYDPDVPVGADGKGQVAFTLPDNTTTYRIMAVAVDGQGRAGSAQAPVTVKLPLMVQPVLPRFVYPGDQLVVSAILHNGTDRAEAATVTFTGVGVSGEPLSTQVAAQGTGTVEATLTVPEVRDRDALVLRAAAVMGAHTDAIEVSIPIREPGVRRRQLVEAAVSGTRELSFTFPDDRVRGTEEVELVVSTTALTKLKDSVDYLLGYPNGCIEQTTSTAYPLVVLEDLLPEIGVDVPKDQLRDYAEAGVRRILSFQTSAGGLSYWPGGTEPHAFATSFGLTALIEAEQRGYDVPRDALEKMADYLELTLTRDEIREDIPHGGMADGDTRALFVMTLGRLGRPQPATLANLWEQREKLTPFGLSFLAIAAQEMEGGHPLTPAILAEVRKAAKVDADSAWYEGDPKGGYSMDSPLRTHASALLAHASGAPAAELTPKLLEGLLDRQQYGLWGNTQENVFGIMGVYTLAARGGAGGASRPEVAVTHNGAAVAPDALAALSRSARRLRVAPDALADARQTFVVTSPGTPANATVRVAYDVELSPENRAPRSAGATIERRWEAMDGTPLGERVPLGSLVRVRLTVTTDHDLNYVAIADLLPAGLEPLNTSLATTRTVDMGPLTPEVERGLAHLSYQEVRDHRVAFYADALPAGTVEMQYVARATTPGSFLRPAANVEAMYDLSTFASSSIDAVTVEATP